MGGRSQQDRHIGMDKSVCVTRGARGMLWKGCLGGMRRVGRLWGDDAHRVILHPPGAAWTSCCACLLQGPCSRSLCVAHADGKAVLLIF